MTHAPASARRRKGARNDRIATESFSLPSKKAMSVSTKTTGLILFKKGRLGHPDWELARPPIRHRFSNSLSLGSAVDSVFRTRMSDCCPDLGPGPSAGCTACRGSQHPSPRDRQSPWRMSSFPDPESPVNAVIAEAGRMPGMTHSISVP